MRMFLRFIGLAIGSYLLGLLAYIGTLWFDWHERLGGDGPAVLYVSIVTYIIVAIPLFLASVWILKRILKGRGYKLWRIYPFTLAVIAVIPTGFVNLPYGSLQWSFTDPESTLFLVLFSVSGIAFGMGWLLFIGQENGNTES